MPRVPELAPRLDPAPAAAPAPHPAQAYDGLARLAGGVAHEFNNLLAGILGCAALAQLDVPEGTEAADALADVQRAGERATALTAKLLAYAGRGTFTPQHLPLAPLLADALASNGADARITVELDDPLPPLFGDGPRLGQLVSS